MTHARSATAGQPPPLHPSVSPRELLFAHAHPSAVALLSTPGLQTTMNARSAINLACRELRSAERDEILLPGFHCPSVVMPAIAAGLKPVFYRVRPDLSVDVEDVLSKTGPRTAALLIIHFFGHATDLTPFKALVQSGLAIIEDWSHSFLRPDTLGLTGSHEHYRVYSFWKLLPTLIGGGLVRPGGRQPARPLQRARLARSDIARVKALAETAIMSKGSRWMQRGYTLLEGARLKMKPQRPLRTAPEQDLRERGEDYYPFDIGQAELDMPALIRRLTAASDLRAIADRRTANQAIYAERLRGHPHATPAYSQAPEAVPWVFPVLVEERDRVDRRWKARGVALHTFGIYLHSLLFQQADAATVADARYLANHLLCLSVHQDLHPRQIETACEILGTP
jgi:dTDP-4-amino-4,6-dideoxygalactose transaminase